MAVTSRFRFWLKFGDTWTTGKSIKIYAAGTTTPIVASTPDIGSGLTVVDNGDGLYYVDAMASGNYDVYVNDVLQTELENYFHSANDITDHVDDADKHREIDDTAGAGDTTDLYSADKIVALLADKAEIDDTAGSGDTTVVYSADKIVALLAAVKSYFVMAFSRNITTASDLDLYGPGGESGDFILPTACTLTKFYLFAMGVPAVYSQTGSISFSAGDRISVKCHSGTTYDAVVYKNGSAVMTILGGAASSGSYRATLLFEK
jgi:hypothetical protein